MCTATWSPHLCFKTNKVVQVLNESKIVHFVINLYLQISKQISQILKNISGSFLTSINLGANTWIVKHNSHQQPFKSHTHTHISTLSTCCEGTVYIHTHIKLIQDLRFFPDSLWAYKGWVTLQKNAVRSCREAKVLISFYLFFSKSRISVCQDTFFAIVAEFVPGKSGYQL